MSRMRIALGKLLGLPLALMACLLSAVEMASGAENGAGRTPAENAQALAGQCPGVPFASSYMVTNRNKPFAETREDIVPAPPGQLSFFTAAGPYQSNLVRLRYRSATAQTFLASLRDDLNRQPAARKSLGIYIHGIDNLFKDALSSTAAFGCALAQPQQGAGTGFTGLLIGFSWPSYGLADSLAFYASDPPNPPSGTIRDNILGSRESFVNLMAFLADGLEGIPVDISILTHSEGNYMLMVGLAALAAADPGARVRHCLMMAADISSVSLQEGRDGQAIADACESVAVYYSGADPTLTVSNYQFAGFHDKDFPTRLGLIGPYYYSNPAPLNGNVVGVDSSKVTLNLPGGLASVHSSYRSNPPVLLDLTQTMLGITPTNRCPIAGTAQGFALEGAAVVSCGP